MNVGEKDQWLPLWGLLPSADVWSAQLCPLETDTFPSHSQYKAIPLQRLQEPAAKMYGFSYESCCQPRRAELSHEWGKGKQSTTVLGFPHPCHLLMVELYVSVTGIIWLLPKAATLQLFLPPPPQTFNSTKHIMCQSQPSKAKGINWRMDKETLSSVTSCHTFCTKGYGKDRKWRHRAGVFEG